MLKCENCNLYWADEWEEFPSCKADPNWPAPCEYEEDVEEEDEDPFNENDPYVMIDPMAFY